MFSNPQAEMIKANNAFVKQVRDDMVFFNRSDQKSIYEAHACGQLLRIGHGVYLWQGEPRPLWQTKRRVAIARAIAASHLNPSLTLTGIGAVLLWGLPVHTKQELSEILLLGHNNRPRRAALPALKVRYKPNKTRDEIRTTELPPCPLQVISDRGGSPNPIQFHSSNGKLACLERTLLDVGRRYSTLTALTTLDAYLADRAQIDSTQREASRQRQQEVKEDLLQRITTMDNLLGAPRLRTAIKLADGFAESPLESWARWHLLRLGLDTAVLQYPIPIYSPTHNPAHNKAYSGDGADGSYRADLAFPRDRILVEVDGFAKYGQDYAVQQDAFLAERERQTHLLAADFHVIRWSVGELSNAKTIEQSLQAAFSHQHAQTRPRKIKLYS